MILTAKYSQDGELLAEGEGYRIVGIRMASDDDDGMVAENVYGHNYCIGEKRRERARARIVNIVSTCEYCGVEIKDDTATACSDCLERVRKEGAMRPRSEALQELIYSLADMRMEAKQQGAAPQASGNGGGKHNGSSGDKKDVPVDKRSPLDTVKDADRFGNFVPTNEGGVVFMFGKIIDALGYAMVYMDGQYPDAVMRSPTGNLLRVEFEYVASNFIAHRHDPNLCDVVICWNADRRLPVDTLPIGNYYNVETGAFDFARISNTPIAATGA